MLTVMIKSEYERAKKELKEGDFVCILTYDNDSWEGQISEIDKGAICIGNVAIPYKTIRSMSHITDFDSCNW